MQQLIECVPNFSEGNDAAIIKQITDAIQGVEGVRLLDVDPGKATNRTVVTFVGSPGPVVEAAFRAIKIAGELIDMSKHKGEHPRMGATDVCPLIPVSGISMEETAGYARQLAQRVAKELSIPVYLYEAAQPDPARKNLSVIRAGEYEGFFKKIKLPEWKPDFGECEMNARCGATVIGARDFLIAYNVNLNTRSTRVANAIAFDIRETGRVKRSGNPYTGPVEKDAQGNEIRIPGSLKECKAIGWYIKEYDIAQISINLTNYKVTPVHVAFDETCRKADERGVRVTGSELVGLIPLQAILEAGRYFLKKQKRSTGVSEKELIHIAVKSLGLDELGPFDPKKKIIEYLLKDGSERGLVDMKLVEFADETASESPAPGGGSIAAYAGVLGVALGTMVANLSAGKRGWEDQLQTFSDHAVKGQELKDELVRLVDEDTNAFNRIMAAFGLPKSTDAEKAERSAAIEEATRLAVEAPFKVMQASFKALDLIRAMAETGNPNSITDAGVGALCLQTAVQGAFLNVRINAKSLKDREYAEKVLAEGQKLVDNTAKTCAEISSVVESKM
jgi:glutamate formiminotransferase/formiminotetrahydrofolate cyclodeaminase